MPRILICDDDADLAEVMGRRSEVLACGMAILDVNLGAGRPSGVDVYRWLQRERFGGKVVFLTGHAPTSSLRDVMSASGTHVLSKPVSGDVLVELARAEGAA